MLAPATTTPTSRPSSSSTDAVDLGDVVDAHLLAARRGPDLGFARYIVSATTPFATNDRAELGRDAPRVITRLFPELGERFAARGWTFPPTLDRVYINDRARSELGWTPRWDFPGVAELALTGGHVRGPLARAVGAKGYHDLPTGIYTR